MQFRLRTLFGCTTALVVYLAFAAPCVVNCVFLTLVTFVMMPVK